MHVTDSDVRTILGAISRSAESAHFSRRIAILHSPGGIATLSCDSPGSLSPVKEEGRFSSLSHALPSMIFDVKQEQRTMMKPIAPLIAANSIDNAS